MGRSGAKVNIHSTTLPIITEPTDMNTKGIKFVLLFTLYSILFLQYFERHS